MLLVAVEKRLDTGLTAQVGVSSQEHDKFLIFHFNATTCINVQKSLIDVLLMDAFEIEAQPLTDNKRLSDFSSLFITMF